ncbi:MAG: hypothetical protein KQH83_11800 [Actinobacteria bacterium]|nr:hypothetical protein [Actinomycetota bacterium]
MPDDERFPRGRHVYDASNGARVGALAGALLGVVPALFLGPAWALLVVAGGAAGAVAGYRWERRRIAEDRRRDGLDP